MGELRAVSEPAKIVNNSLVEALEKALREAREGRVASGGVYLVKRDGEVETLLSDTGDVLIEIAAVSRLLHSLHKRADT